MAYEIYKSKCLNIKMTTVHLLLIHHTMDCQDKCHSLVAKQ